MSRNLKEILQPGAHVVVVGLGKSGVSAVRFLLKLGVKISVSEGGRAESLEGDLGCWLAEKGVFVETGGHTAELLTSADCLLVSPGVPLGIAPLVAARQKGIPVIGELALAKDFLKAPVVAVTGTNGKSTVTTLIGDLLRGSGRKAFVGGNIGIPLAEYLAGPQDCEVVVLEVSSFQLDSAGEFRPQVGVLLNITPDHLDRYASYEAYVEAKISLFKNQQPGDVAVLNGDDPAIAGWLAGGAERKSPWPVRAEIRQYSSCGRSGVTASVSGTRVRLATQDAPGKMAEEYELAGTPLAQAPNSENAMAAILAVRAMGCSPADIRKSLAAFTPLPHRLALVAEIDGISYYDDSKATNVGAVYSALGGMQQPVVLIAGGRDKGGGYEMLLPLVREKVRGMVLIGEAKEEMAKAFAGLTRIAFAGEMPEAVQLAGTMAQKGDAVLLSPACASFDMFSSYSHRGEVFTQAVSRIKQQEG
ncbi:MAG: UDP-N-acetylmuramoylalanine--D-glutamate ligase [Deltaproteobacteria bacterium RIFOXYD12_FULL_55_16]|nr:MAG: UDP-N-acetylmuramoylalanine--D-glutamate ligase [Deltaproteobacteria bacterium RIFOXYD12_FULL_55_16]